MVNSIPVVLWSEPLPSSPPLGMSSPNILPSGFTTTWYRCPCQNPPLCRCVEHFYRNKWILLTVLMNKELSLLCTRYKYCYYYSSINCNLWDIITKQINLVQDITITLVFTCIVLWVDLCTVQVYIEDLECDNRGQWKLIETLCVYLYLPFLNNRMTVFMKIWKLCK